MLCETGPIESFCIQNHEVSIFGRRTYLWVGVTMSNGMYSATCTVASSDFAFTYSRSIRLVSTHLSRERAEQNTVPVACVGGGAPADMFL
jgi:hypothetical protein